VLTYFFLTHTNRFVLYVIIPDEASCILDSIRRLQFRLSDFIEPDFSLLDQLLSAEVLTDRQYAKVRSGDKTVYEKNDIILQCLASEDQCGKFLTALYNTGQAHVANFIEQNGG